MVMACPKCFAVGVFSHLDPLRFITTGQCASVRFQCNTCPWHSYSWCTSPLDGEEGSNMLLTTKGYFAALCAGLTETSYSEVLTLIGFMPVSHRRMMDFQNGTDTKYRKMGWMM